MTKIRNVLLLIMLVAGLSYGGLKLYLYYQIKHRVDQIVQMAAPYVGIKYAGISTTLEGAVFLENLKFRPAMIDDEISVDTLELITPGLGFLLGGGEEAIGKGEIPKKLGVSVSNLRINLAGALVEYLAEMEATSVENSSESASICTLSQLYQTEQLKRLGMEELLINASTKLNYNKDQDSMVFNMNFALLGIEEVSFEFTLEEFNQAISGVMQMEQSPPNIKSVSLSYRPNLKFTQQVNQYCADLKGSSIEEFIEQLVNQSDDAYREDFGIIPGAGIRKALKTLLSNAGELTIAAQSNNPIDFTKLHLYKAEDIPAILGLSVTVNGEIINDLSFTMDESARVAMSEMASKPDQNRINKALAGENLNQYQTSNQRNGKRLKYHVVQANQLSHKIGLRARIKTKDGKFRRGLIIKIRKNKINLKMPMRGGTMSVSIPITDITHVEVQEWL